MSQSLFLQLLGGTMLIGGLRERGLKHENIHPGQAESQKEKQNHVAHWPYHHLTSLTIRQGQVNQSLAESGIVVLTAGDELQERCLTVPGGLLGALQGRRDFIRILDSFAPAAERPTNVRIIAADVLRTKELVRGRHMARFSGHKVIVQHHSQNWNIAPDRGLEIQSGHAEGGISHKVDAKFLRCCQFRSHDESESGAQSMGFSPTDVTARDGRLIKRNKLVARAAGIMSDNCLFGIDGAHELPENSIGVNRDFFGSELRHPLLQPRLSYFIDLCDYRIRLFWSVRSLSIFYRFNKLPEHRLS